MFDISVQKKDQFGALVQASMPLLAMPAYYGIGAAKSGVEATHEQATFNRNELFLSISQAYYGAVASRRLIEVAYQQVQAQLEQERVSRVRFEVGEVPKVDWLRASVARSQAEKDLLRAKNAFVSTKLALQALTGVKERFDVLPPEEVQVPDGQVDDLVRTGLERRKDLQASRSQVELTDRLVKAAWWQFAPVLSTQGQLTWANVSGFTGSNLNWNVQLVASLNVFDGLRRYADLSDARSRRRQAEAARANLAREVTRDVKASLLDLETARSNLLQAKSQADLASESADLVLAQYEAGVATYLDVTDALSTRFAAEVSVVTEQLNVQVASLKLSRAIGRYGVEQFP
jgi:outer membrane protein TolC